MTEFETRVVEAIEVATEGCQIDSDFDLEAPSGKCLMCEKRALCELWLEIKEMDSEA